jgi:hypothetical protein
LASHPPLRGLARSQFAPKVIHLGRKARSRPASARQIPWSMATLQSLRPASPENLVPGGGSSLASKPRQILDCAEVPWCRASLPAPLLVSQQQACSVAALAGRQAISRIELNGRCMLREHRCDQLLELHCGICWNTAHALSLGNRFSQNASLSECQRRSNSALVGDGLEAGHLPRCKSKKHGNSAK